MGLKTARVTSSMRGYESLSVKRAGGRTVGAGALACLEVDGVDVGSGRNRRADNLRGNTRASGRTRVDALTGRMERAEQLERDAEALLEQTAGVTPEDLEALTGDQRNEIYRMLHLEITPSCEGYAIRGVFRAVGLSSTGQLWAAGAI